MSSLDALTGGGKGSEGLGVGTKWTAAGNKAVGGNNADEGDGEGGEDELFAIAPNPRGPEMARSPFSLVSEEVVPWR